MTRDEVIKALRCCTEEGTRSPSNCAECPYGSRFQHGCIRHLMLEALNILEDKDK